MSSRNADETWPVGGIYVKLKKATKYTFAMHVYTVADGRPC